METPKIYRTFSEKDTYELGFKLVSNLKPGDAISLEGDLGTGKTALTKGIAAGLGIKDPVTSPTFTLVNTYEGKCTLHHFDVYRIDDPDELLTIGWDEYFDNDAITVVEWGDRIPEMLPADSIHIRLESDTAIPNSRTIIIERKQRK